MNSLTDDSATTPQDHGAKDVAWFLGGVAFGLQPWRPIQDLLDRPESRSVTGSHL